MMKPSDMLIEMSPYSDAFIVKCEQCQKHTANVITHTQHIHLDTLIRLATEHEHDT